MWHVHAASKHHKETRPVISRSIVALACVIMAACGCPADLTIHSSPTSQTLRVGESFTPIVSLKGCLDTEPVSDVVRWSSSDTTVAITNASTGLTTARRPGTATISAEGMTYHLLTQVPLTVVP